MTRQLIENEYAITDYNVSDSILNCAFKYANIDLKIAKICVQTRYEASKQLGGEKYRVLIDITNITSVSKEARDYFAAVENLDYIMATALIVKSPVSKMIGNIFLYIISPLCH